MDRHDPQQQSQQQHPQPAKVQNSDEQQHRLNATHQQLLEEDPFASESESGQGDPLAVEVETEAPGAGRGTVNVRSRVRYWLNDIVDEMRKKSPASVQKWVDSIQLPNGGGSATISSGSTDATPPLHHDDPAVHRTDYSRSDQLVTPDTEPSLQHLEHDASENIGIDEPSTVESKQEDRQVCFPHREEYPDAGVESIPCVLNEDSLKKNNTASRMSPTEARGSLAISTPKMVRMDDSAKITNEPPASLSIRNFLSKKSLLGKFSRSGSNLDHSPNAAAENVPIVGSSDMAEVTERSWRKAEDEPTSTSPFVVSKSKINEFYDKLNMNKAKYGLIKGKKLDIRNMLGGGLANRESSDISKTPIAQPSKIQPVADAFTIDGTVHQFDSAEAKSLAEASEDHPEPLEVSVVDVEPSDAYEFSFDDSFPKSDELVTGMISEEDEEEKENILDTPSMVPGHGYGYDVYLNPPKPKAHRIGIGRIGRSSSENPRATARRYNLMEIGRSFSEMNDDDDSFAISECNNSCPNPSSLNTSSSINNGSISNLTRSVPVSPVPRTSSKLSIQQETQQQQQQSQPSSRRRSTMLVKDSSLQSDSSRCSSVESLLNARKPDPEKILLNLGFGPAPHSTDVLAKIPKRFLKPSQVRGVDTEAFLRQQQLSMHIHENSVLGYRGLVGNPHIPPSMIVAKIMERFQENDTKTRLTAAGVTLPQSDSRTSSGPPSPIPMVRHASLATADGRIKF
ncbi:uncharacterized protein LOC128725077 [Anopheles nili]|uniref:uncharacterized protein LOC128725077 n=1 Tax=Anopheles nili TaxID=185578 RepID=UPI00237B11DD|nr:uncharacterized protein LOC128725077 [Anopheles nili]